MPVIPFQKAKTSAPVARRPLADPATAVAGHEGLRRIIRGGLSIADQLNESRQRRNRMQAGIDLEKDLQDAETAALQNEEPEEITESYRRESEAALARLKEEYGDDEEIDLIAQRIGNRSQHKITRAALRKELDLRVGVFREDVNRIIAGAIRAEDELSVAVLKDELRDTIDREKGGAISHSSAAQLELSGLAEIDKLSAVKLMDKNPALALAELDLEVDPEGRDLFPDMDPNTRLQLIRGAKTALAAERRKDAEALSFRIQDDLSSLRNTGKGFPDISERFLDANPTEEQTVRFLLARQLASEFHVLSQELRLMPPAQRAAMVAALKPTEPGIGFAERQEHYEAALAFNDKLNTLQRKDPAALAAPDVAPPAPGETMEDQITKSLAVQASQGTPPELQRPLGREEAQDIVRRFDEAGTDQQISQLREIATSVGRHHQLVFKQLQEEGLPLHAVVFRDLPAGNFRDLIESQKLSLTESAAVSATPGFQRKNVLEEATAIFNDEFGRTIMPGSEFAKDKISLNNIVRKLAVYYETVKGLDDGAERANKILFGREYIYRDTQRIPVGNTRDVGAIVNMGADIRRDAATRDLFQGGPDGMAIPAEIYATRVETDGKWYLGADHNTYYLHLDRVPVMEKVTINGTVVPQPVTYTITQALAAAAQPEALEDRAAFEIARQAAIQDGSSATVQRGGGR